MRSLPMRALLLALIMLLLCPVLAQAQQYNYNNATTTYQPRYYQSVSTSSKPAVATTHTTSHHDWTSCYAGVDMGGAFADKVAAQEALSQGGTFAAGTPYNNTSNPY